VASALIAISMMLSSILRLRLVNLAGAAAFAVYGLLIGSVPVAILNGLIVVVNAHYLLRMLRAKEYFHLLSLRPDSDYLSYFLGFHAKDIHGIFPEFTHRPGEKQVALFILRDCTPAGVFIAEEHPDGVLRVVLDYAVPRIVISRSDGFSLSSRRIFSTAGASRKSSSCRAPRISERI
jgi:hypothetical protein